ncbi:MAG: ABC transporter ATP-binding protein [Bacteroidales bacterium]|nr:ABC transporter ATP-binding protein [Bacteroidales bacterium]
MTKPTAIKFENISKQYRLGTIGTGTLSHDLNRWWQVNIRGKEDPYLKIEQVNDREQKATSDYVWALKNIDFSVKQGEVLGIIGKNGAGKSTLLKILSRVTNPTTGRMMVKGRIASLLEVGTGFHPEMTGRENIFMNGSIMGMNKSEISRKLDEIVAFAGVEKYIDTPVKRYSSGMTVRLGFAIAAHMEPEILVVDEVLAVGDAEFQKKAIGRMQDVSSNQGRTVLFVSHNMNAVKSLCSAGIVLEKGGVKFNGGIDEAIELYLDANTLTEDSIQKNVKWTSPDLEIENISINNSQSNFLHVNNRNPEFEIAIEGAIHKSMVLSMEIDFYDVNHNKVAFFGPGITKEEAPVFSPGKFKLQEKISLPKNMSGGTYLLDISITHPNVRYYMKAPKSVQMDLEGPSLVTGHNDYGTRGYIIL